MCRSLDWFMHMLYGLKFAMNVHNHKPKPHYNQSQGNDGELHYLQWLLSLLFCPKNVHCQTERKLGSLGKTTLKETSIKGILCASLCLCFNQVFPETKVIWIIRTELLFAHARCGNNIYWWIVLISSYVLWRCTKCACASWIYFSSTHDPRVPCHMTQ